MTDTLTVLPLVFLCYYLFILLFINQSSFFLPVRSKVFIEVLKKSCKSFFLFINNPLLNKFLKQEDQKDVSIIDQKFLTGMLTHFYKTCICYSYISRECTLKEHNYMFHIHNSFLSVDSKKILIFIVCMCCNFFF